MNYIELAKFDHNKYGIGDKLLYYYNLFGDRVFNQEVKCVDAFKEMVEYLYKFNNQEPIFISNERLLQEPVELPGTKKALVAYSSGVDSTYKALALRKQGYDVTLFHARKINRAYPDESKKAVEFSKDLGFPMVELEVKKIGKEARVDNPVKDQLILGYALEYGIQNGISHYSTGNYHHYHATPKNFEEGMSNVVEMFDLFEKGISMYIKNYSYSQIDETKYNVFKLVLGISPESLEKHVASCITPLRFKNMLWEKTTKKFGIKLMHNHCGTCYKCIQEYLILRDLGFYPDNQQYVQYCCDFLRNKPQTTSEITLLKSDDNETIIRKVLTQL
jgi:7-cyano-7-deazaguanine synthase in queuosine biosynthesis